MDQCLAQRAHVVANPPSSHCHGLIHSLDTFMPAHLVSLCIDSQGCRFCKAWRKSGLVHIQAFVYVLFVI